MRRNLFWGAMLPLMLFAVAPAGAQLKHSANASATAERSSGVKSSGESSSGSSSPFHSRPESSTTQSSSATYTPPPDPEPTYSAPVYSTPSSSSASYSSDYSSSGSKGTSSEDSYSTSSPGTYSGSSETYRPAPASSGSTPTGGGREITGITPVEVSPVVLPPTLVLDDIEHAVAELAIKVDTPDLEEDDVEDLQDQCNLLQSLLDRMDHHGRKWQQINYVCIEINTEIDSRLNQMRERQRLRNLLKRKAELVPFLWPQMPEHDNSHLVEALVDSALGLPDGGWDYYQNMQYFDPVATQSLMWTVQLEMPECLYTQDYLVLDEFFLHFHESQWDAEVRQYLSHQMEEMDKLAGTDLMLCEAFARNLNLIAHAMLKMMPDDVFYRDSANYTYSKIVEVTTKTKP